MPLGKKQEMIFLLSNNIVRLFYLLFKTREEEKE